MHILNSLAPIFLILALGAVLVKSRFLSETYLQGLNRLTYWVGLPCLLFYKIASANHTTGPASRIFLVVVLGMAGVLVLSYLTAWLLRMPAKSVGTFVQAAFRGNLAFIGLPVLIYTSADLYGQDAHSMEMLGVLVIAPMVPIYNCLSVLVLLVSQQELNWQALKKIVQPIVTNPLVIASLGGLLVVFTGKNLPMALHRTLKVVGDMSLPLALISIGGSLVLVEIRGSLGFAATAALLKMVLAPLLGYFVAQFMGLAPAETRIALIYLACPTAVSSFVLVDQIGGDNALAASAVVISTILAMFSLGFVVAFN
ncbi:MAG: AEC family transporter [bacterium]